MTESELVELEVAMDRAGMDNMWTVGRSLRELIADVRRMRALGLEILEELLDVEIGYNFFARDADPVKEGEIRAEYERRKKELEDAGH